MTLSSFSLVAALASPILMLTAVPCVADERPSGASPAVVEARSPVGPVEAELTLEERKERESRKVCKIAMCAAFHAKKTEGGDISCNIVKSWRKEQLTKLVAKMKVTWPYAGVRCTSAVKIKRVEIGRAISEPKSDMQLDPHSVACVVSRDNEAATDIKFDFSPKVSFENGKAIKAQMNWGKIEAPALIKSALWTATAADNTVNFLSNTLIADINDFIAKKCDEVKAEWAGN